MNRDCHHFWSQAECSEHEKNGYWQTETLADALQSWALEFGDTTAVVDGAIRLSYRELFAQVERTAHGLQALGLQTGDRVLLQLPNSANFVICSFALFTCGVIPIMVMPAQRENDIQALCDIAAPKAYIVPDKFLGFDHLAQAQQVRTKRPELMHIIVDDQSSVVVEPGYRDAHIHRFADLAVEPRGELPPVYHRDVALLLLSGGTTGTPKLIPRTHADYLYNARQAAKVCELSANTVYLVALPAAHNFPLACPGILGTLSRGGKVVMARTPGFDETFPLIARERVTVTALVPSLVQLWLQAREWDQTDLSSLRVLQVGGAPLELVTAAQVEPLLGCQLQQVYGMAEGLICFTRLNDPASVKLHTQGRPMCPADEIRIVDESLNPVEPGEAGELLVRGPYTIRGYYRALDHNRKAFTGGGFYRTGDLVKQSPQGDLTVVGRVKDQVNRAGEKIACAEIEQALQSHPDICHALVVAVSDKELGERACAFVISQQAQLSATVITRYLLAKGLARYRVPDQIEMIAKIPLTPVGKPDKRYLIALAESRAKTPEMTEILYAEQEMVLTSDPLDLATRLVQAGLDDNYVVYEKHGEWLVAIGEAATLTVTAAGVQLSYGQTTQQWRHGPLFDRVTEALQSLPIKNWRAYGAATFELSGLIHGLESRPAIEEDDRPLLHLFVPRYEIRIKQSRALIRAANIDEFPSLVSLCRKLDLQQTPPSIAATSPQQLDVPQVNTEHREAYLQGVQTVVGEIQAKRYQKAILARRVNLPEPPDMIASFIKGYRGNTPARAFLVNLGCHSVAGFSPETVVEVSSAGQVSTQPLAGTRALSHETEADQQRRSELLSDTKEIAEHAMSVKLSCEEMAHVCAPDSIAVPEFMAVRHRGSVQHLASRVVGTLQAERNAWHAFAALFPAVTASGIPKRESIEAIQRLEPSPRGYYSGSVMVVDSDGSMDASLVLRSMFRSGEQFWLCAGAGIVDQSQPGRELQETIEKLGSVAQHLVRRSSETESVSESNPPLVQ